MAGLSSFCPKGQDQLREEEQKDQGLQQEGPTKKDARGAFLLEISFLSLGSLGHLLGFEGFG